MRKILFLAAVLMPILLKGQIADTSLLIEDVVVSGPRMNIPFNKDSRSIEIISKKMIEKIPARDVAGILQYATGIDIRQRGPHGVQADIGIRGGSFEQTLILINGIKMTDPQTGHHIMNIPITPDQIERIEIIKGPAARIYGQNAFSGAINIITKTSEEFYGNLNVTAGQNQVLGLGLSMNIPGKLANQSLSINRQISEGYKYNTDYDIQNLLYQASFDLLNYETTLLAGYTERKFGANGFYASPAFQDQYEEIQTSIIALQSKIISGSWIHNPRIYWRRNQDEYLFVRSNPSLYRNLHIGNNIGAEWNSTFNSQFGITGIGAEVRREHLISNNLGERNRNLFSAYAEQRLEFGDFYVTPGLSFQYYSDFGPRLFYGVDASYSFNEYLSFFGNAGTTYRVPSYTDLYYEDPANLGNPDLRPETAFTYEVGLKSNLRYFNTQISYFNQYGRDMIDWVRDPAISNQWMPVNLNQIPMTGIEVAVNSDIGSLTGLNILGFHRLSYTYIDAEIVDNDAIESRYLLENLRHQFTYVGNFDFKYFETSISFRYLDRVSLEDYSLVDLRFSKSWKKSRWFLDVNNLLDINYRETNLVEMPGRWIVAGASFKIF